MISTHHLPGQEQEHWFSKASSPAGWGCRKRGRPSSTGFRESSSPADSGSSLPASERSWPSQGGSLHGSGSTTAPRAPASGAQWSETWSCAASGVRKVWLEPDAASPLPRCADLSEVGRVCRVLKEEKQLVSQQPCHWRCEKSPNEESPNAKSPTVAKS